MYIFGHNNLLKLGFLPLRSYENRNLTTQESIFYPPIYQLEEIGEINTFSNLKKQYDSLRETLETELLFKSSQSIDFNRREEGAFYDYHADKQYLYHGNKLRQQNWFTSSLTIPQSSWDTNERIIRYIENNLKSDRYIKDFLFHAQNSILKDFIERETKIYEEDWQGELDQKDHNFSFFKKNVMKLNEIINPNSRNSTKYTLLMPRAYQYALETDLESYVNPYKEGIASFVKGVATLGQSIGQELGDKIEGKKDKPLSIHIKLKEFLKEKEGYNIKFHDLDDQSLTFLINEEHHYDLPYPIFNEISLKFINHKEEYLGKVEVTTSYIWPALQVEERQNTIIKLKNLITT